jgi:hypothetical protein
MVSVMATVHPPAGAVSKTSERAPIGAAYGSRCGYQVVMGRRVLVALLVVAIATGAFLAGRSSVDRPGKAAAASERLPASYRAGREDAFSGFDGGWAYTTPYIVTLTRAGPGITYRFARRWPMLPDIEYRACGGGVCERPARP